MRVSSPTVHVGVPTSPYRGLAPYFEGDAAFFFGRDREREVIVANLMARRLTLVYGESGVGKSSLLHAGVLAELQDVARHQAAVHGSPEFVPLVFAGWRDDPVAGLGEAARKAVGKLVPDAVEAAAGAVGLHEVLSALADAFEGELLVVLDQFEEYFLYHPDEDGPGTFAAEFPRTLASMDLPVNFLLCIREDALARLDYFKTRIPGLFQSYLRIEHLDRAAAEQAIREPIEEFNRRAADEAQIEIEPALVDAVLEQVAAGRVVREQAGAGVVDGGRRAGRVETPYLQLVMSRLWEEEMRADSLTIRLPTLERLGGANEIVRTHLDYALAGVSAEERRIAAEAFHHLVTPSGTKIAYRRSDLAEYTGRSEAELSAALEKLSSGEIRILRPVAPPPGDPGSPRYEIFHDVLAPAILDWRTRYETERKLAAQRQAAHRRQRRLLLVATISLVALALMAAVAAYAFSQRSEARDQAAEARRQAVIARGSEQEAKRQTAIARDQRAEAQSQRAVARKSEQEAKRQAGVAREQRAEAERQKVRADEARSDAEQQAQIAEARRGQAQTAAARAQSERRRAENEADSARQARGQAQAAAAQAKREKRNAVRQRDRARGREFAATALADVAVDPARAVRTALTASVLDPTSRTENVLRTALLALRIRAVLPGSGGPVRDMDLSSDGRLLVIGSERGGARIFDVHSVHLLRTLRHDTRVAAVAVSPDGRLVATGAQDGRVRLWSRDTGALLRVLAHQGGVRSVSFSSDGSLLVTASADATARVWQAATGILLQTLPHPRAVRAAAFSPDGRLILTVGGDESAARVYDAASGAFVARLQHPGEVTAASWSADGALVATTGRRNGRLWERTGWTMRHELVGHEFVIRSVSFSPDGTRVVTASADGTARLWRTDSGSLIDVLRGHDAPVDAAVFSSDGRLIATGSEDRTARLAFANVELAGHTDTVTEVVFSPREEKVVTGSSDGTARVWNTQTEQQLALVGRHDGAIAAVAYSPDGTLILSAGADGMARIWREGRLVRTVVHGGSISDAAVSTSGLVLTVGPDGNARLWRVPDGRAVVSFAHGSAIRAAALTRDEKRLVTGGADGTVRLWDVPTGRLVAERAHAGAVTAATFSRDGSLLATGGEDARVRLWRASDGRPVRTLLGHSGPVASLDFSTDARRIASAAAGTDFAARIWNVDDGSEIVLEGHEAPLTTVRYSPNGKLLLTAGANGDVRTWKAASGAPAHIFRGHVAVVADAVFSPDSRWIVTAGPGAAALWQASTGARLFFLRGHDGPLRAVAFARGSRQFTTGGADGTVRRYECTICGGIPQLRALAKARLRALERANAAARGER